VNKNRNGEIMRMVARQSSRVKVGSGILATTVLFASRVVKFLKIRKKISRKINGNFIKVH